MLNFSDVQNSELQTWRKTLFEFQHRVKIKIYFLINTFLNFYNFFKCWYWHVKFILKITLPFLWQQFPDNHTHIQIFHSLFTFKYSSVIFIRFKLCSSLPIYIKLRSASSIIFYSFPSLRISMFHGSRIKAVAD